MKFKTTAKQVKAQNNIIVKTGYCDLWHLLYCQDAIGYNAGVYGWNWDFYDLGDGVTVCTGYRPIGDGVEYSDIIRKYETKARKEFESDDWKTRADRIGVLVKEFKKEAKQRFTETRRATK